MTPTDQQVGELDRRLTRLEPLVRRRSGGGVSYPPGGDPGEVLTFVGPNPNDVAWASDAGAGDRHYTHSQGTAATVWNVTHNLGKYPSVTVLDSAREEIEGQVDHLDVNHLNISFSGAVSGSASLN